MYFNMAQSSERTQQPTQRNNEEATAHFLLLGFKCPQALVELRNASQSLRLRTLRLALFQVGASVEAGVDAQKVNALRMTKKRNISEDRDCGLLHNDASPLQAIQSQSDDGMKSDINRILGYMDLLDEYSLHHFVIWQGKVIRDTPEFASLMRTHQADWSAIAWCVAILENIMTVNAVPLAVIDGKQLGDLARFDLERVDEADLCSCIANFEQIQPSLRHLRLASSASSAAHLAAVTVQAAGRRFLKRSGYLLLKRRRFAAIQLQRLARGRKCRRRVASIFLERRAGLQSAWLDLQKELQTSWEGWRENERVIVYMSSAGAGEDAPDRQHHSMSRVHWLVDPKVHVVCVTYSLPDEDVLEYHRKILAMSGVRDIQSRITVVVPENMGLLPNHISLVSMLLYSPRCLRRVAQIVRGRPAFIVSDAVDWQEKRLAVALGVPLLSAEPSVAALSQTQSGMKRIFAAADVNVPIGAYDIYDEEDLLVSLTKLIACNLEVRRWHIKVDVSRGNRGLAMLDTASLACMAGLKRERVQLERANGGLSGVWHHPDVQLLARSRLLTTLRDSLHRDILIYSTEMYATWTHFLAHLVRVGGVIDAEAPEMRKYPSAHLFLSPNGQITFLSETEKLLDACHRYVGCVHPQGCVSPNVLCGASAAVGRELFSRGVMGYLSVHFVVYWSDQVEAPRLWAIGLELGLSGSAFSFCLFRSLTRSAGSARNLGCYEESTDRNDADHKSELGFRYCKSSRRNRLYGRQCN